LRDFADAGRLFQHFLRLFDDALSHRRDGHFALATLEQRRAQFLLELLDGHRQRGLADETLLRGAAEVPFLGNGDEVAQLGQRHGSAAPIGCAARESARNRHRFPGA
jgi:hypothetical protein